MPDPVQRWFSSPAAATEAGVFEIGGWVVLAFVCVALALALRHATQLCRERAEALAATRRALGAAERKLHDNERTFEDRVRLRTAELEAANRDLEAFGYTASHDLRAPLRAIDAYTLLAMQDPGIAPRNREGLVRARAAACRMSRLVEDLLRLARLARCEVRLSPVDLTALAEVIVDELRHAEPDRVVEVTIARGLRVRGDPTLVRIALENLLCNAWKYTSRTPGASIGVGGAADAPGVVVVRDNGAGFDMQYVTRLFRPFERLHSPREFEGSGVGLAIVARVVARHGGAVHARGEVGAGATFWLYLPDGAEPAPDLSKLAAREGQLLPA